MERLYPALALAGFLVLALGLLSRTIKGGVLSEPMVATGVGVLAGPQVLGWLDPASWGPVETVLTTATRLTLAIALMGVALRIEHAQLRAIWRPMGLLLTAGMLAMWVASAALADWWLGLGLWTALLLGAVVTPTDPVVSSAIVTGRLARRNLPGRLRGSLSLESGANDGLAFLLVMLPLGVLVHSGGIGAARAWLVDGLLVGVLLAVAMGAALGYGAAVLLELAKGRGLVERHSVLSYTVALSLTTLGAARLCGADALIAVFAAGLVFNIVSDTSQQQEEENVQEAVSKLFMPPVFVLFGAVLPWQEWQAMGWPLLGLALGVLVVRRPLALLICAPLLRRWYPPRELAFLGWFGPVGVAALFYAAHIWERTGEPFVFHAASAVILASIIAHGATAAPLTRLFARHASREAA
ncbi:cation:proton antiporter domain-containing protein [Marinimicrococcus flavescens]|uniref:Cation:proton antiporter n=1 Tax=Marinimicrococcus flavescens TaxID=3031815 RepID=A0AAP3XRP8_9PROT|nr:cation:proton antiporter [Marinimicrococcus flavescens]